MAGPDNVNEKTKKVRKGINAFALLFCVLVFVAILSYILPAGQFARETVDGREMITPGSYQQIESTPVNLFGVFSSIHEGMVQAAPIIFYVFIIGGMFNMLNSTGAIDALLSTATRKLAKREFLFIAITMLLFSIGGSLIGMAEESLIYIPIIVPVALALGYDVITGVAIVLFGMSIGFTSAAMNPFTIGIAHSIAGLPMFSGIGARLIMHAIMYVMGVTFIYNYARKVKKDPSRGYFADNISSGTSAELNEVKLETKHKLVLIAFVAAIVCIVFGSFKYGWYLGEMSAVFIILTLVVGFISKMSIDEIIKNFLAGAANIIAGALIIGLAKGIVVVLTNGNTLDTILNAAATALQNVPASLSVVGMFLVQAVIHFLVPSGSGQAMLTMPVMVPLADLLHITRQTACFIFTLADGIGSIILPTCGYFMAALAIAKVPYGKWAAKVLPLIALEYGVSIVAAIIANQLHYGPF